MPAPSLPFKTILELVLWDGLQSYRCTRIIYIYIYIAENVGSNPTGGLDICRECLLSGRGLCDELITCPEESY
jgi:hypothetical protein